MELPQYTDYEKISEMNPFAAWQAGEQMDLARQFQQQKLTQAQEEAKRMQLANIFSEQKNPLDIEQQQQLNLEHTYGMPQKRITGEIAEATAPQQRQQAVQDALLKLKQSDITMLETKARQMAYSNDPAERQQGLALMQLTPQIQKLQMEETGKMTRETMKEAAAKERAQIAAASARERITAKAVGNDILQQLMLGKMTPDKAFVAINAKLGTVDTEEEKQFWREQLQTVETFARNQALLRSEGKIDIGKQTGIPTRQVPPAAGAKPTSQKHSLSEVQKMYPGVPPEKIREAYKQKFGVDLE